MTPTLSIIIISWNVRELMMMMDKVGVIDAGMELSGLLAKFESSGGFLPTRMPGHR